MTTIEGDDFGTSRVPEAGIPPESRTTVDEIRTWLESTDLKSPLDDYSRFLSSYLPGTGSWIVASDAYTQWHDSAEIGVLWVKGASGTGKSVWAASMVHRLAKEEQVPVLYFCFHRTSAINRRPHSMVRSWMCQLLNHSGLLQSTLRNKMQQVRDLESVSLNDLWTELQDSLYQSGRVYCVVDSLDEMDAGELDFIPRIVELGKLRPRSIKLVITSRPIPRVEEFLKEPTVSQVLLEARWTKPDVKLYIESRLKTAKIVGMRFSSVKRIICHKAQGLFLYARLAIDNLVDRIAHGTLESENLEASIENLPPSLNHLYSTLLAEHSTYSGIPQDQQTAILRWLLYCARPLRLLELAELIRYTSKSALTLKEGKNLVRASCGRLLEVLEDETVSVIHHSLFEVFARNHPSENPFAINERVELIRMENEVPHDHVALICVEYVNASCLGKL
jgi:hypothetical protein